MNNTINIKEFLQNKGYKYTRQRQAVYETFVDHCDRHMTTEEVYLEVVKNAPDIGIATVYRTVQLFEDLGILTSITFEDGLTRYELKGASNAHNHHHLICIECNKIIEVNVDLLDSLEMQIERNEDFIIMDHNLKFFGYCADCYQKLKGVEDEEQQ